MRHRRVSLLAAAAAALLCFLAVVPISSGTATAAAARARPATDHSLPARIGAPARVLQMVTVVSDGWHDRIGELRAWERPPGGVWQKLHGPVPVVIGYSGWVPAAQRLQNTGTTPAGRFGLPSAFGILAKPSTRMPYNHVDGNDWWPYEPRDPATYNIYQYHRDSSSHWRADFAEHLADYQTQYAYALVVGFNLPTGVHYSPERHQRVATVPADTKLGGGIFLHVRGSGFTAGCVAMDQVHMEWLLQWLDPAKYPQVVMGPYNYVLRLCPLAGTRETPRRGARNPSRVSGRRSRRGGR